MKTIPAILLLLLAGSCLQPGGENGLKLKAEAFQSGYGRERTDLFVLANRNGMTVALTNYGARIVSVCVPDRRGEYADVVLGFSSVGAYRTNNPSHGSTIGPYANRIANGRFNLGGTEYRLPVNNGKNCIHSGPNSFYRQVWEAVPGDQSVRMTLSSSDGEWGFPGNKTVALLFTLTDNNELQLDYSAVSDKPTHINLTNHSYFNLRGEGNGTILDHKAVINARKITPVDSFMIPTGEHLDIAGTPLDFTLPRPFGEQIGADHPQLSIARGYDFNYVLDKERGKLGFAAGVYEPESGRYLEVFTTEPGVQLYTGNYLNGRETGKSGVTYGPRSGFCLETQHFPDSPNQPGFPSTLLLPGDTLRSTTLFRFSVKSKI